MIPSAVSERMSSVASSQIRQYLRRSDARGDMTSFSSERNASSSLVLLLSRLAPLSSWLTGLYHGCSIFLKERGRDVEMSFLRDMTEFTQGRVVA